MKESEGRYGRLIIVCFLAIFMAPASFVAYLLWWFLAPCTVYSENYSEKAFRSIAVGHDMARVQESLGPPYRVVPPYTRRWAYDGWVVFFDETNRVQVDSLYQWSAADIREFMGELPAGMQPSELRGKTTGEMRAEFGAPMEETKSPWGTGRLFFYTHPSAGGMWADRTWKKRMLTVNMRTNRVTKIDAYWRIAGN